MRALLIAMIFFAGVAVLNCQLESGTYAIRSANDEGTWDMCGAATCELIDTDIFTYTEYRPDIPPQRFVITALENGFYTIIAWNFAVQARESDVPAETLFLSREQPDATNVNQQFAIVARNGGTYMIKPRGLNGLALRAPAAGELQQIIAVDKDCTALDQRFKFVPIN